MRYYSPDRLSRNYAHQLVILDKLRRNGVDVEFVNQPVLGDNPQAHLLMGIQGLFAEYERAIIKERMRLGRLHKLRTGQALHTKTPYGYRYVPVGEPGGGQWVIDEVEAETVRQIFAWHTGEEAVTIWAIVERLNQSHRHALRRAKKWQFSTVRNILQHTAYIGYTYFNRERCSMEAIGLPRRNGRGARRSRKSEQRPREEWIEAKTPAIVDEAVWHEAQARVKMNQQFAKRNNSKNFYLLRGLLVCQTCGYTLQGKTQNGRKYYFCARGGRKRHEDVPHHINRQKATCWKNWSGTQSLIYYATQHKLQLLGIRMLNRLTSQLQS